MVITILSGHLELIEDLGSSLDPLVTLNVI